MRSANALRVGLVTAIVAVLLGAVGTVAASAPGHAAPATSSMGGPSPASGAPAVKVHYTIPLGKLPDGGAFDNKTSNVYVSNEKSNSVTVVSSLTHVHSTIGVGKSPSGVVFDSFNGDLYVPNLNSSNVSIIDGATNKVIASPSLGKGAHPASAYVDPANGNVLVFNNSSYPKATVVWVVMNSTHAVKKLTLGLGELGPPAYSPVTKEEYVENYFSATVSVISASGALKKTLTMPGAPSSIAYDAPSTAIWVSVFTGAPVPTIEIITTGDKLAGPFTIPSPANTFMSVPPTYDPYNHILYYLGFNTTKNQSYAIGLIGGPTVGSITLLGSGASYLFSYVDPGNRDIYVLSLAKKVAVLGNNSKLVTTLSVAQPVVALVYDPTLNDMVGAGDVNITTTSTLYCINATNSVSTLKVGKLAVAFLYDPTDTYVYVANIGSSTLDLVG